MSIKRTRHQYIVDVLNSSPKKKKKKIEKVKKIPIKKKQWIYEMSLSDGSYITESVFAHTRSEARSEIKKINNIKGRLPVGIVINLNE